MSVVTPIGRGGRPCLLLDDGCARNVGVRRTDDESDALKCRIASPVDEGEHVVEPQLSERRSAKQVMRFRRNACDDVATLS